MFASRLHPLVNNLCVVLQNGYKIRFLNVLFYSYIKKNVNYRLVIIIRVCHWLIIHDDETVISYFMPRHQTFKFAYNFKAKRYNVNFMNNNQLELKHLGRLSVIKWRNWTWWESNLDTEINDETQIAVVVWPQWD